MKTTIYWAIQHIRRAAREIRFTIVCWWLNQQVEFLEWRLRLEALFPQAPGTPVPVLIDRRGPYAARTM